MDLTVERVVISNRSKPRWTVLNHGERLFKTEEGFLTWDTRSWARYLIRKINEEGLEATDAFINKTIKSDHKIKRTPNSIKYFMSFTNQVERCILNG